MLGADYQKNVNDEIANLIGGRESTGWNNTESLTPDLRSPSPTND
jgi:hypothetical protein